MRISITLPIRPLASAAHQQPIQQAHGVGERLPRCAVPLCAIWTRAKVRYSASREEGQIRSSALQPARFGPAGCGGRSPCASHSCACAAAPHGDQLRDEVALGGPGRRMLQRRGRAAGIPARLQQPCQRHVAECDNIGVNRQRPCDQLHALRR